MKTFNFFLRDCAGACRISKLRKFLKRKRTSKHQIVFQPQSLDFSVLLNTGPKPVEFITISYFSSIVKNLSHTPDIPLEITLSGLGHLEKTLQLHPVIGSHISNGLSVKLGNSVVSIVNQSEPVTALSMLRDTLLALCLFPLYTGYLLFPSSPGTADSSAADILSPTLNKLCYETLENLLAMSESVILNLEKDLHPFRLSITYTQNVLGLTLSLTKGIFRYTDSMTC